MVQSIILLLWSMHKSFKRNAGLLEQVGVDFPVPQFEIYSLCHSAHITDLILS